MDLLTFKSIVVETVLKAGISPRIAKNIREAISDAISDVETAADIAGAPLPAQSAVGGV